MTITKYDASGNTFVIFHTNEKKDYSQLAIELCKTESTDGLIVVVPHLVYDFEWLFYNNDGSTASMCGNGTRAVAHYAYTNQLCGTYLKFLTGAGEITCVVDGDIVKTTMPKPKFIKDDFEEENFTWYLLDTGVPHLVTIVDNLELFDLELCATMRNRHNANVNFAKVQDRTLLVRTYERGVENETLACGTGMTAAFLVANRLNLVPNSIDVYPKSGELLTLSKDSDNLYFQGKVTKEYTKSV
ncbi:MAG: diaminopimelate epimerase [Arcobacteraceae bacterium]|nr:diaminopimelate epimerase [Arcobacteraceae bacterium]